MMTRFTDFDIQLFRSGKHFRIYDKLGSHLTQDENGQDGTYFAVWAPNGTQVSVVGHFNNWNGDKHQLTARWDGSGIWEGFIPNIGKGTVYKYQITSYDGKKFQKGDPYARRWEIPPATASIVWDTWYEWSDDTWMKERQEKIGKPQPMSVYEVHFGSWARTNYAHTFAKCVGAQIII